MVSVENLNEVIRALGNSICINPNKEATPLLPLKESHKSKNLDVPDAYKSLEKVQQQNILFDSQLSTYDMIQEEAICLIEFVLPMVCPLLSYVYIYSLEICILVYDKILGQAMESIPNITLTIMAGNVNPEISTEILAAFNLSGLVYLVVSLCFTLGVMSATDTLCSQAFGGKQYVELWYYAQAAVILSITFIPLAAVVMILGPFLLDLTGQDPTISTMAGHILLTYIISMPFFMAAMIMRSTLQAQNIAVPYVMASVVAVSLSMTLSYGIGFHTSMGYLGIALGQPILNFAKAVLLLPFVWKNKTYIDYWPGWNFTQALVHLPRVLSLSISGALMTLFSLFGFMTITLLAGKLPDPSAMIAANGMFCSIVELGALPMVALSIAGAIRIGNALGAGRARRASSITSVLLCLSTAIGLLFSLITPLLAKLYVGMFTGNPNAIQVALKLIDDLRPMFILIGIQCAFTAVYKGCGKQLLAAALNLLGGFVIGVPFGLYISISLQTGLIGLWFGNLVGMIVNALITCIWFYHMSWYKMIESAQKNTHMHQNHVAKVATAA